MPTVANVVNVPAQLRIRGQDLAEINDHILEHVLVTPHDGLLPETELVEPHLKEFRTGHLRVCFLPHV